MRISLFSLLFNFVLFINPILSGQLFADELNSIYPDSLTNPDSDIEKKSGLPTAYFHAGLGIGVDWYSSGDVEKLFEKDFEIQNVGGPFSWSMAVGYKNIVQLEYRVSDSGHDFTRLTAAENQSNGFFAREKIKMDYDYIDTIIKINPFFWQEPEIINNAYKTNFVLIGLGTLEHFDQNKDGFKGDALILGYEYAILRKYISASFGFKYYSYELSEFTIDGIKNKSKFNASNFLLYFSIGFGAGI